MPETRSEEDVLRGVLRVQVGKEEKELPILSIAAARKWKLRLGGMLGSEISTMRLEGIEDGSKLALAVGDKTVELVLEYDQGAALGGREWFEANATDAQAYAILKRLIEVSFPFVRDLKTLIAELRALGLADLLASAQSLGESSTNGRSPDGDSLPLVSSAS